jgi:hypothetical protein
MRILGKKISHTNDCTGSYNRLYQLLTGDHGAENWKEQSHSHTETGDYKRIPTLWVTLKINSGKLNFIAQNYNLS